MSAIQKMSIQGVRSFGPEDGDKQLLQFFTPLTLILGPNGTGKTTIIECLKYITTGDMPPNANRGGNFIHDPKIAHENEVRGQVKLQLKDVRNESVCVTRSVLLTQKQKKVEVKTLDGTLVRMTKDGEKKSISSKCADLNKELVSCLGVSKPILNNVIFCHQEDSNWPLSEGKALKEKFDEIFAATRYIKALDNIRKIRADQAVALKVYHGEITFLQQNKEKANEVKKTLADKEVHLASSKDSVKKIQQNLRPVEDKLDQILIKENEIAKVHRQVVQKEAQLLEKEKSQQDLKNNIKNLFEGSVNELLRVIRDFQKKVEEKQTSLEHLEDDIARKNIECEQIGKEKSTILLKIGKLKTEEQQHRTRIQKRDEKLVALCHQYNIEDFLRSQENLTDGQVGQIVEMLESERGNIQEEGKLVKTKYEEREADIQSKMDCLRDSKTKLEQSIKFKTEQMNKSCAELKLIDRELSTIETSDARLNQVEDELSRAEREFHDTEASVNIVGLRSEIETRKKDHVEIDANVRKLDAELQKMHSFSSIQAELDINCNEKISKEESIKKILKKHEETLLHLLGHIPSENIRYEVDTFKQKLSEDVKRLNSKRHQYLIELSSFESRRKMMMEQLKKKEDELKSQEEKIFEICGSQNFNSGLENLEKSIKELQDEKGALVGTQFVYSKFIERLQKKDPCCPLCHREFDEEQDIAELINDLNTKLRMIPSQMDSKSQSISSQQGKFNSMLELRPIKNQLEVLNEKDIPDLKLNVKNLGEQIEQHKKEIADVEETLEVKEMDEATAESILGDMVSLDQAQIELRKVEKKIAALRSKMTGSDSSHTVRQVTHEKEVAQRNADRVKQDLERLQEKYSDHTELIHALREKVNELRDEKLNIKSKLQRQTQLEEKRAELISIEEECKRIVKQAKEQLRPLETKWTATKNEKDEISAAKEAALEKIKHRMDELQIKMREVEQYNIDIRRYVKGGSTAELYLTEQQEHELEIKLETQNGEKLKLNSELDDIRKEFTTQQVRQRELADNLQLRRQEDEMDSIREQTAKLKDDLGEFDIRTLHQEKMKLRDQIEKFKKEKNHAEGRQLELEGTVRSLKNELEGSMYKDAEEKYKEKLIQLKTTEIVSSDLNKYSMALDKAIMKHHAMKMTEINKIIQELWRNTYRGNDIDYIEIRSDEDDVVRKTDKRRVYHYRVVMVKGDTALDMRGRCSAGQKVLASIIIRLALAETFGLNCGVLALDEPTTNLDSENIEGLADALVDIVKTRQKQKNFQLVVITHDEDFLERLGRSEFVDHYYRIGKNNRGLSTIQKCASSITPL